MLKSFAPRASFICIFFIFHSAEASSASLSLSDFIQEAVKQSPTLQAAQLNSEGAQSIAKEGQMVFSPQFFAQYSYLSNSAQASSPFSGDKTVNNNFKIGFQKQFDFGLATTLSHSVNDTTVYGLPVVFVPTGTLVNHTALTSLEFNQSLWRNFGGRETRSAEKAAEANALANHYAETLKHKELLANVELAYHRLALARESIQLRKEVYDRAQKIYEWAAKRVRNQLADKTDMLQTKAAFQARELELDFQKDQERSARIAFNQMRNIDSDSVPETLHTITNEEIFNLKPIQKSSAPDSIRIAEETERAVVASNEMSRQKVLPDLSLFGQLGLNGLDQNKTSAAVREAFGTQFPLYAVGVKLSMPLYFLDAAEIRAGRIKQQLGAEASTRQKKLEFETTWSELEQKFESAKRRLKLVSTLVESQKEKLDHEKYRLNLGRTTTYQVLTFEQDYAEALINQINIQTETLTLYSKMKLFGDSQLGDSQLGDSQL